MVRKMAIGQLQAASITNVGMHDIPAEPQALSVPLMFDSAAELQKALPILEPELDAPLEKKGYVALTWGPIGAMSIFCSKPYRTPAEAAGAKIFAWEGDPGSVEAWKAAGFHPVVLSSTDVVPSLQTGMIDCITNVPLYVLTTRMFEKAPYMIDVTWGCLVGATIVRKDAWEKIPADLRPEAPRHRPGAGQEGGRRGGPAQRRRGHRHGEAGAQGGEGGRRGLAGHGREVVAGGARRGGPGGLLRRGQGPPGRAAGPGRRVARAAGRAVRGEVRHVAAHLRAGEEQGQVAARVGAERRDPGPGQPGGPAHRDDVVQTTGHEEARRRRGPEERRRPASRRSRSSPSGTGAPAGRPARRSAGRWPSPGRPRPGRRGRHQRRRVHPLRARWPHRPPRARPSDSPTRTAGRRPRRRAPGSRGPPRRSATARPAAGPCRGRRPPRR